MQIKKGYFLPVSRQFLAGLFSVFAVYLLPRIILGEDSYVTINDNLDSELIWRLVLKNSGLAFSLKGEISQIMNGLPREFMISGLNLRNWSLACGLTRHDRFLIGRTPLTTSL